MKRMSLLLAFVMLTMFIFNNAQDVFAQKSDLVDDTSEITFIEERPSSLVGTILLCIGAYVIGKIVDGVVISYTDKPVEVWVSEAVDWMREEISTMYFDDNGNVIKVAKEQNNQRCYKYSPNGLWMCQAGPDEIRFYAPIH